MIDRADMRERRKSTDEDQAEFYERLRTNLLDLRLAAGMTQTQLAHQMDWNRATVSGIELGYQCPSCFQSFQWYSACQERITLGVLRPRKRRRAR